MIFPGVRILDQYGFRRLAVVPAAGGRFVLLPVEEMGKGLLVDLHIERGFLPMQNVQMNEFHRGFVIAGRTDDTGCDNTLPFGN